MRNLKRIRLILLTLLTCAIALFGASCNWFNQDDTNPPDSGYNDEFGEDGHRHEWGEGVISLEATCSQTGETVYTCSVCNQSRVETVAKLPHDYDENCVCLECGAAQTVVENCVWDISKANDNSVVAKLYADTDEDYKLVVTGTGEMKDFSQNQTPWVSYTLQIKIVVVYDGVRSVGNYAFANLPNLISVSLPESLTAIGSNVFTDSDSIAYTEQDGAYYLGNATNAYLVLVKIANVDITTVVMFEGSKFVLEEAFKNCANLQSVSFSPNLLGIGANAFENCVSLQEVILPDTLTQLGASAFAGCVELVKVVVSENITVIEVNVFINCVKLIDIYLPDTIYVIKDGAFAGCGFPSINLPSSLEQIGNNAFKDCIYLEVIVIPDKVEEIGTGAFNGSGVKEIILPESLTIIKANVFVNCTYLVTVHIPETVTVIEADAFKGCTALKELIYTGSTEQWEAMNKAEGWAETNLTPVQPVTTNYVTLSKLTDGTYSITGSSTALKGTVIIPETVTVDGTEYKITQIGYEAFYSRRNISRIILPSTITKIGERAFGYCSGLTNLTIPEGVTEIGNSAFSSCGKLQTVKLPQSLTSLGYYAFQYCSALTSVNLPEGLTEIKSYTFSGCYALTNIEIPKSVTVIEDAAFSNCKALKKVTIPESTTKIGSGAFSSTFALEELIFNAANCENFFSTSYVAFTDAGKDSDWLKVTIGKNVQAIPNCFLYNSSVDEVVFENGSVCTSIGSYAFACTIKKISLPETITTIRNHAFYQIAAEKVVIPASVTTLGQYLFNSSTVKEVTILANVTSLPDYTFASSSGLEKVTLPDSLEEIGNYAFRLATKLTNINFPPTLKKIGSYAFAESGLETLTLNEGLETIDTYAFQKCPSLKKVILPETLSSLGNYAFFACTALTKAVLPSSLATVSESAFMSCAQLSDVTLSEGITKINASAFEGCSALTKITLPSTLTSIGFSAFSNCNHLIEVYNLSSLNIQTSETAGSQNTFGYVGLGALNIYTDLSTPSKLFYDGDFLCYKGTPDKATEEKAYIIWYTGTDENPTLPENIGGLNYGIYEFAFFNNHSVTSLTLPDTVISVGQYAFQSCKNLVDLDLGNGLQSTGYYAFSSSGITSVSLPSSLTTLANFTFNACKSLKSVTVANGLTEIPYNCFSSCSALEEIVLPASVTKLGDSAFASCTSLKKAVLPSGLTVIPTAAFSGCTTLTEVQFPTNLKTISSSAFKGCAMTSVNLPASTQIISATAFENCANLTEVSLPADSNLYSVSPTSFKGTGVSFTEYENAYYFGPQSNPYLILVQGIDNTATTITFHGKTKAIATGAFTNFTNLTSVTIPDSIQTINHSIFQGCSSLTVLNIPFIGLTESTSAEYLFSHLSAPNVTHLTVRSGHIKGYDSDTYTNGAFYNNKTVLSVTLGAGVKTIGTEAFKNCDSLTYIYMLEGLETIGNNAFYQCKSLKEIYVPTTVVTIGAGAFQFCSSLEKLTIPFVGCGEGYSSSNYESLSEVFNSYSKPQTLKTVVVTAADGLGYAAFKGFNMIENLYLPSTITYIKNYAFEDCDSLTNLYIEDFGAWCTIEYGYYSCEPLFYAENFYINGVLSTELDLVIPDSVAKVTSYALSRLKAKSVTVNDTVREIENCAFYSVDLGTLYYNTNGLEFGSEHWPFYSAKIGVLTFGNKITKVPSGMFNCNSNLIAKIGLVNFVEDTICTEIGDNPFGASMGSGLQAIVLPETLTTIGSSAFASSDLTSIHIPASVTTVSSTAFFGCSNLLSVSIGNFRSFVETDFSSGGSIFKSAKQIILDGVEVGSDIVIPDTATKIGSSMFMGCPAITSVTIPDSVTQIGQYAFHECRSLTNVYFTGTPTLETIERGCFAYSGLPSITIPDSVKTVGDYAFQGCSALTNVRLGNAVETILEGAFKDCTGLTEITIPASVNIIYCYAFRNCSNLTSVTFERPYYWNRSASEDAYLFGAYFSATDPTVNANYLVNEEYNRYFKWSSKNW